MEACFNMNEIEHIMEIKKRSSVSRGLSLDIPDELLKVNIDYRNMCYYRVILSFQFCWYL